MKYANALTPDREKNIFPRDDIRSFILRAAFSVFIYNRSQLGLRSNE